MSQSAITIVLMSVTQRRDSRVSEAERELLQAAMRQPESPPIGIVPFGSGNVLSRDIGVNGDAASIAQALTNAVPTNVAVGMLSSRMAEGTLVKRFFTVAAGVGADARVTPRRAVGGIPRFGQHSVL